MCSENSRNVASQERNFLGLREISIGGTSPQPRRMVAYLLYLMSSGVFLGGDFIYICIIYTYTYNVHMSIDLNICVFDSV